MHTPEHLTPSPQKQLHRINHQVLSCLNDHSFTQAQTHLLGAFQEFMHVYDTIEYDQYFSYTLEDLFLRENSILPSTQDQEIIVFSQYPQLKPIYERIKKSIMISNNPVLIDRFWKKYGEPLYKGSLDFQCLEKKQEVKIPEPHSQATAGKIHFMNFKDLKKEEIEVFLSTFESFSGINIYWNDLLRDHKDLLPTLLQTCNKTRLLGFVGIDFSILRRYFHCLTEIEGISLNLCDLHLISQEDLEGLSQALHNAKSLEIAHTHLSQIQNVDAYARFFFRFSALSFRSEALNEFSPEALNTLFGSLPHLRSLSLHDAELRKMESAQLRNIFSHLPHLQYLEIYESSFSTLSPEKLSIIFGNLPHLRSLDLKRCNLASLAREQVKAIFGNISQLKSLKMHYPPANLEYRMPEISQLYNS